jgi:hypothetical protein
VQFPRYPSNREARHLPGISRVAVPPIVTEALLRTELGYTVYYCALLSLRAEPQGFYFLGVH